MTILRPDAPGALTPESRARSLRETVLEKVRAAIITGELPEGAVLTAPTLGPRLGVSATPVREAMVDLTREGLVEGMRNKGFRVIGMSSAELDDLTEVRLLIEPPAMHRIDRERIARATDDLVALADRCFDAATTGDLVEYLRTDRQFHALLLACTGNSQLADVANALRMRTRMYGITSLATSGRLAASAAEHHRLVELLRAGDGDGAEAVMRAHIGHARGMWATGEPETD